MSHQFKYKHISPTLLELYWPPKIAPSTLKEMTSLKATVQQLWQEDLLDVIMGYHCLSLRFKAPFQLNDIINKLEEIAETSAEGASKHSGKRWLIPVWYSGKDLNMVAEHTGLSADQIINLHKKHPYLLYFYGFMPGFMYLGGLDERLFAPRKTQPDPLIEKGAVAIGGKQTGIYPMDSPGGWNVIGKTPVQLFNIKKDPPLQPQPGDEIKFEAISKEDFHTISTQIAEKNYQIRYENT
ncbi:allophanate hydrolase subunit 1 [Echinicola strongylocentroti]|uniref:Allophanate hydrolase subunit 1 n=1 Tax=Echinicola strongylocentroti TaxID=1795355 RepID=A0A2Z4IP42_9BACT|nr:5-oxoprolinase subunit PxpB [Echinicola strongylocentroti]AWW32557.1 allophanate hydrolase subunit 1 [Echinicola strongylocentroti]